MDDATHFDGLSINPLGTQFEAWAEEQGRADKFPSYRMFIVVDEESFNSLQNAPIPAELPTGTKRRIAHYVKLVEVGQEHDHDSLFPGWMKCSLKGLWDIWRNMQDGDYMRSSYMMVHERREFIEVLS
ncbi:hypothetical protein VN97_g8559 [Penicillium thymicola]|uniref:Uncharacterized protein n=1 Tax=Penicillium thymicola TaxID=293382 RepID=A0AAI9X630_PENTH|nr:hypothetical protein VN97_g8559 [Penicillium thymicola]